MTHRSEHISELAFDIADDIAGEAAAALDGSQEATEKLQEDMRALVENNKALNPVVASLDELVNQSGLTKRIGLNEVIVQRDQGGGLTSIEFVNAAGTSLSCSQDTDWQCKIGSKE